MPTPRPHTPEPDRDPDPSAPPPASDPGQDDPASTQPVTVEWVLQALSHGALEEQGLLPYSSNYNFLVLLRYHGLEIPAVYKPRDGETPLWDFPRGTLHLREVAAFRVSQALGWDLVPPTVLRQGPRGPGSLQFFVHHDPNQHYFAIRENARYLPALRRLALFDFVVNNADRKSGHCLVDASGRLWAIDHGICFHQEYKLRTVIWEFSDQPIPEPLLADLAALAQELAAPTSPLRRDLAPLLSVGELAALAQRLEHLLERGCFPAPLPYQRNFPWPPI